MECKVMRSGWESSRWKSEISNTKKAKKELQIQNFNSQPNQFQPPALRILSRNRLTACKKAITSLLILYRSRPAAFPKQFHF